MFGLSSHLLTLARSARLASAPWLKLSPSDLPDLLEGWTATLKDQGEPEEVSGVSLEAAPLNTPTQSSPVSRVSVV